MDIRKYFSQSAKSSASKKTSPKKGAANSEANGLARERQLNLSPAGKQTKDFKPKKAPQRLIANSSDENSDGESPISRKLRVELKKNAKKIVSSDEDEDFHSASSSHPTKLPAAGVKAKAAGVVSTKKCDANTAGTATLKLRRGSFRDDESSCDSHYAHSVERRTARKTIDESVQPFNEIFTNKKRKAKEPTGALMKAPKQAKRESEENVPVPEKVIDELFTAKGRAKSAAVAGGCRDDMKVRPLERVRNPKIDKLTSPSKTKNAQAGKDKMTTKKKKTRFEDEISEEEPEEIENDDEDDEDEDFVNSSDDDDVVESDEEDFGLDEDSMDMISPKKVKQTAAKRSTRSKAPAKSSAKGKRASGDVAKRKGPIFADDDEEEMMEEVRMSERPVNGRRTTKAVVGSMMTAATAPPPRRCAPTALADLPWVDKYRPTQLTQLVGQHTEKSPLNKLLEWLRDWPANNLGAGALEKKAKPGPFMAQSDGTAFRAALLSGPPGIGKTTCAVMACRELGLRYVETNASDARNKKTIEAQVSGVLECRQMDEFFVSADPDALRGKSKVAGIDQVLIMDEVDGMSGNQDRAGIAELILMIKRSKIPIICVCNDRQSTKIRSLANHCFDLRFSRPRVEQIKGRLLTIAAQEHLKVSKEALDAVIEASNQDIRQCIHSLQMMAAGGGVAAKRFEKKDVAVNCFEAARRMLSNETNLFEKQELFFSDYSIMPLFVHENYLNVRAQRCSNAQHLSSIRQAADYMAFGDVVDKQVRSLGAWNLLVEEAMFSCALPAMAMDGHLTAQLQFPAWFGKTSNEGKRKRFMRQLASHTHRKISGSTCALVTDYLPVMRERLYRPLVQRETDGVREVVDFYKAYDLVRDDTEAINDLGIWPKAANKAHNKDLSQRVSTKTKSALTRALTKEPRMLPFAQEAPFKGRRKAGGGNGVGGGTLELDEEGHEVAAGGGGGGDEPDE